MILQTYGQNVFNVKAGNIKLHGNFCSIQLGFP